MKIYHLWVCEDDLGEADGMFDENGNILGMWSNNDATWRGEYFNGFMKELGHIIVDAPVKQKDHMKKKMREYWGLNG